MSIVSLITDFGLKDYFVAAIKAELHQEIKDAHIIDISHQVSPFNHTEAFTQRRDGRKSKRSRSAARRLNLPAVSSPTPRRAAARYPVGCSAASRSTAAASYRGRWHRHPRRRRRRRVPWWARWRTATPLRRSRRG